MSAQPQSDHELRPVSGYTGGPEMTLLDHLKELRNRVIKCALALLLTTGLCFWFWKDIFGWLLAPARVNDPLFKTIITSPTDSIGVIFKIGLYGGVIIASPVFIYQFFAFVVPGLTPQERRAIFPGLFGAVLFLAGGMAFAYWIILPASLHFLLNVGDGQFQPFISTDEYISFTTRIMVGVGLAFELPMVMAMAARFGLLRARQMLHFWRYSVVIVFIIAAIITPTPDPFNQSLVGGPLLGLYFLGVGMAWIVQKPRPQPQRPEAVV
jgi:sec-independent protein translocase protein TatC